MESDAELIARSLAGDGEAFAAVIGRHETALGAYLERRVGRQLAQDLLGDVWVAAYGSRRSYDLSFPNARPWLFGVALNKVRRYWQSRPSEDLVPDLTGLVAAWDSWPGVDERVAVEATLRASLARLQPKEREVVTLVAWEDLTVADAARTLGMPAGTVRRLLHQARQALRNMPGIAELSTGRITVKETR
jgi:RNA polymerase sigma-70 factor (ECF subfamily)